MWLIEYLIFILPIPGANNVGTLFNMAGQVGKAVGSLVTVMTDDEGSGDEEIPPRPSRPHRH